MTFAKYPVTGGGGGGSGDVVGPASSTNGAIALWNGTTGKLLQDSAILSSSLVLTSGAQSIAGVKTFSNEPSAPTIALTATSNQMSFGSGPNKITVSVANNPAANLTYSIPNIAAVSLTGTFCLLEGANQTFSGTGTIFTQTVRFDASTPLWLGSSPNRVILSPGSQASPRTWLFPDLSVDPTFAALEGTQSFSGNKTFAGTLTVPGSVNYTSAGSITKSGAGALTLTNASTAGLTFAGTGTVTAPTGTYTLAGLSLSNVFTVAQTITATSNQIVLHSGVNQLTLNSSTSAAARVYSFPDVGITGTVAMLEGAQTFSALKTFSSGLNVSGGSAANGSIWFASNVLRQRGGTSGWAVDNTSGNAIISATDVGALTLGPAGSTSASLNYLFRLPTAGSFIVPTGTDPQLAISSASSSGVVSILGYQNGATAATGLSMAAWTKDGNTGGDFVIDVRENDNSDFATLTNDAFKINRFGTNLVNVTRAGALTLGPATGSALNIGHLVRGSLQTITADYSVTSGGVTSEVTPGAQGSAGVSLVTSFTDLSTTARNVANGISLSVGILSFILINVDGDNASFQVSAGIEEGIAFKYSVVTGSTANCSITGTSTLSITGLGDGRTYTLTFNTGTGAATLSSSTTATGTTRLHVHSLRKA